VVSREGHELVVELPLDQGTDVNVQGGDYRSALQVASERGRDKIVELLLGKGADVNTRFGWHCE
jgi:hypothetical protein